MRFTMTLLSLVLLCVILLAAVAALLQWVNRPDPPIANIDDVIIDARKLDDGRIELTISGRFENECDGMVFLPLQENGQFVAVHIASNDDVQSLPASDHTHEDWIGISAKLNYRFSATMIATEEELSNQLSEPHTLGILVQSGPKPGEQFVAQALSQSGYRIDAGRGREPSLQSSE